MTSSVPPAPLFAVPRLPPGRLAESGFFVIVYGDANHPEVTGILGWAKGQGIATLDEKPIKALKPLPRRLGILSQTTQVPAYFIEFVKKIIDFALVKDSEIRIIDTICHDIRERQAAALELARRADLMLVVGGRSSANTNRLAELCSRVTETHLIETAEDIQPAWIQGKALIGVTSGASTASENSERSTEETERYILKTVSGNPFYQTGHYSGNARDRMNLCGTGRQSH